VSERERERERGGRGREGGRERERMNLKFNTCYRLSSSRDSPASRSGLTGMINSVEHLETLKHC
jgi:hypothetical protein